MVSSCKNHEPGCACPQEAAAEECHINRGKYGTFYDCAVGQQTCVSGQWSACIATGAAGKFVELPPGSLVPADDGTGVHTAGLASGADCANPCSPGCTAYVDTATGLDAGPGLSVGEGGVAPTGVVVQSSACTSLALTPPTTTLVVDQLAPLRLTTGNDTFSLSAALLPAGCFQGTPAPLWAVDRRDMSLISSAGVLKIVSPLATTLTVGAFAGALATTATVNVTVAVKDNSGAPAGFSHANFPTTTGTADTHQILYPYDGTVLPLALPAPVVQWRKGANGAAAAVKVTLRWPSDRALPAKFEWSTVRPESTTATGTPSPTPTAEPRAVLPQAAWEAFERTARGSEGAIFVQRIVGGVLRSEQKTRVKFADGQLKGTVFYNSYGTKIVLNYPSSSDFRPYGGTGGVTFGAATLAVEPGATVPRIAAGYASGNSNGCRVCHSVAANGSRLVTNSFQYTSSVFENLYNPGGGTEALLNPPASNSARYSWPAIYPDGSMLLTNRSRGGWEGSNERNRLYGLLPANRGVEQTSVGLTTAGMTMPTFSPDGSRVAFNFSSGAIAGKNGDARSLAVATFVRATGTFSGYTLLDLLAGTTKTAVWPTFLPNGNEVVYQREIRNNTRDFGGTRSDCEGHNSLAPYDGCHERGSTGELWYVPSNGLTAPRRLDAANGLNPDGVTSYLPGPDSTRVAADGVRWGGHTTGSEVVYNYEPTANPEVAAGYRWIVFTSRRLYGNVAQIQPYYSDPRFRDIATEPTTKKLWVSAIKLNPAPGEDPSSPAFYLPGQELLAGNARGFWVKNACVAPLATRTTANVCDTDLDCCGAPATSFCSLDESTVGTASVKRHCLSKVANACIADDSAIPCSADAECCGVPTGSKCAGGRCVKPPPILQFGAGTFIRDFTAVCPAQKYPRWQLLKWDATIPAGSRLDFAVRTDAALASLASALPKATVAAATASGAGTSPTTLDAALRAAGGLSRQNLRLEVLFTPTADLRGTPELKSWTVNYTCEDAE